MEFLCRNCGYEFKKTLTLKEKVERYLPKFCSKKCAEDFVIAKLKKTKKIYKGVPHSSKEEKQFGDLVKTFFPDLESQYRLKNYDHHYDFYCPYLNLIIEYNGEYWHNKPRNMIKDKKHLNEATRQKVGVAIITDREWKIFMESGMPNKQKLLKLFQSNLKNTI